MNYIPGSISINGQTVHDVTVLLQLQQFSTGSEWGWCALLQLLFLYFSPFPCLSNNYIFDLNCSWLCLEQGLTHWCWMLESISALEIWTWRQGITRDPCFWVPSIVFSAENMHKPLHGICKTPKPWKLVVWLLRKDWIKREIWKNEFKNFKLQNPALCHFSACAVNSQESNQLHRTCNLLDWYIKHLDEKKLDFFVWNNFVWHQLVNWQKSSNPHIV